MTIRVEIRTVRVLLNALSLLPSLLASGARVRVRVRL